MAAVSHFEEKVPDEKKELIDFLSLQRMKATKCPTDELSLKNAAIVSPYDFSDDIK